MLELKEIRKSYNTAGFIQKALDGVSVAFPKSGFVAVLGPSGSGKTTLLNIIGGLDRADSGEMYLNGAPTSGFSQTEWDAYRNNCIGFVFQSYNLIGHLTVAENVELGMVLSGLSLSKRKKKAKEALEKMGIGEHAGKKPGQMSGGQMQRVAIARAIAPDPEIILADEPTGALDSVTSEQIMDILKELSKEKLVIMVTHNGELADRYADRILRFKDGRLVADSAAETEKEAETGFKLKKTSMSFLTALRLSLKNIFTKKLKTSLTATGASIGIIGISLILALSNGFGMQIDSFQARTLGSFPITVMQTAMAVDPSDLMSAINEGLPRYPDVKTVYPFDRSESNLLHRNVLTDEFVKYVEAADRSIVRGLAYGRSAEINMLYETGGTVKRVSSSDLSVSLLPLEFGKVNSFLNDDYDFMAGEGKSSVEKTDIFLVIDPRNRLDKNIIALFGLDADAETIDPESFIGKEFKLIPNDVWYSDNGGIFSVSPDLDAAYASDAAITLRVAAVVRGKESSRVTAMNEGFLMRSELMEDLIAVNSQSKIVAAQKDADISVRTGMPFSEGAAGEAMRNRALAALGDDVLPSSVYIYPVNFDAKEQVLAYLDDYNAGKEEADRIVYTDMAATISSLSSNILNGITIVLVVFSSISLVVSSIMIGIITYSSVIERTREIGILRALGARKRDICRVFNAETFITGVFAGLIGIVLSAIATIPANAILYRLTELENVAVMNPFDTVILVAVCVLTSVAGGLIPAVIAARKDPVAALRAE